jgi:predicted ATP-dependent Lon-type protease
MDLAKNVVQAHGTDIRGVCSSDASFRARSCSRSCPDRLHTYLRGWEIDVIQGEMFATGYGFIVDYLAEVLRHLRGQDRSSDYRDLFTLDPPISTRDRDGVQKTFSGLMKLLFPGGGATPAEIEELLSLAMEGLKPDRAEPMQDRKLRAADDPAPCPALSYYVRLCG